MSLLFGIFGTKNAPSCNSFSFMRALIHSTTEMSFETTKKPGPVECGVVLSDGKEINYCQHNDAKTMRTLPLFKKTLLKCAGSIKEGYIEQSNGIKFMYGFTTRDYIPNGKLIVQGNTVGIITGILFGTERDSSCPYEGVIRRIDNIIDKTPWPDCLSEIKRQIILPYDKHSSFHCIFTPARAPKTLFILSKNRDSLGIRTSASNKTVMMASGPLNYQQGLFRIMDSMKNTTAIHLSSTDMLALDLENLKYTHV